MLQRIEVAMAWGEYMNAHARIEAPSERGQVKKLQQKLAAARVNGDAQFLLERMSARLDRLGRNPASAAAERGFPARRETDPGAFFACTSGLTAT
jgi:site-specific recombinase